MLTLLSRRPVGAFLGLLALVGALLCQISVTRAEAPPPPLRIDFTKALGLDAERAATVASIMDDAMAARRDLFEQIRSASDENARAAIFAKLKTLEGEIRAELAKVLTKDEMAKLDAMLPKPREKRLPG
jgi:hypothetical protein